MTQITVRQSPIQDQLPAWTDVLIEQFCLRTWQGSGYGARLNLEVMSYKRFGGMIVVSFDYDFDDKEWGSEWGEGSLLLFPDSAIKIYLTSDEIDEIRFSRSGKSIILNCRGVTGMNGKMYRLTFDLQGNHLFNSAGIAW